MNMLLIAHADFIHQMATGLSAITLKSSLILLTAAIACWIFRNSSASKRHWIWLMSLGATLFLPVLILLLPSWNVIPQQTNAKNLTVAENSNTPKLESPLNDIVFSELPKAESIINPESSPSTMDVRPATLANAKLQNTTESTLTPTGVSAVAGSVVLTETRPKYQTGWIELLLTVWLFGSLIQLSRLAISCFYLTAIQFRISTQPDLRTKKLVEVISAELDLAPPRIVMGNQDSMPSVWGIFRTGLLLPSNVTSWSNQQLRNVILHELIHLKRRDTFSILIAQLTKSAFWFNPLVLYAHWQLAVERELACDDCVLRLGTEPCNYAETLLQVVTEVSPQYRFCHAPAIIGKSSIEYRIRSILNSKLDRKPFSKLSLVSCLLLLVLLMTPLAVASTQNPETSLESDSPTTVTNEPASPKSNAVHQEKNDKKNNTTKTVNEMVKLLFAKNMSITGMTDAHGNIKSYMTNRIEFDQNLKFFETADIIDELELVGEQRTKMIALGKFWRKEHQKLREEYNRVYKKEVKEDGELRKAFQWFPELDRKYEKKVQGILLSHQYRWLKQIQLRYLLRVHGLINVSKLKPFRQYTGVTDAEITAMRKKYRELQKQLSEQGIELRKDAIKTFLKPLNTEQSEKVHKKWKYLASDKEPKLEQFRAHMNLLDQLEYLFKIKSHFARLEQFPLFEMGITGTYKPKRHKITADPKQTEAYLTARFIQQVFKSEQLLPALSLSNQQYDVLEKGNRDFTQEIARMSRMSLNWSGGTHSELLELRRKTNEIMYNASKAFIDTTQKSLSSDQWNLLEGLAKKALIMKSGPLVDLVRGDLGKQLKLSKSMKQKLEASAKKSLDQIKTKSIKIEDELLQALLNCLKPESRKKAKELLGPKLKKSSANIDALIIRSSGY